MLFILALLVVIFAGSHCYAVWRRKRGASAPEKSPITTLEPGELRRVARISREPDSHVIYVRRSADGGYVAVVDSPWTDDDLLQQPGERADTLTDLYRKIGAALQTPTHWYDKELEPYFPFQAPKAT